MDSTGLGVLVSAMKRIGRTTVPSCSTASIPTCQIFEIWVARSVRRVPDGGRCAERRSCVNRHLRTAREARPEPGLSSLRHPIVGVEGARIHRRLCPRAWISRNELFDIGLAVGEACANAVMHAVTARSTFRVEATVRADDIVVTVSDPGDDPLPQVLRDPDRVGGLGLFLIRHLMDQLSLEMSTRGTRLTMSRRRRAA